MVFKKGQIPWNKGKTIVYSEEIRRKISEAHKGHIPWNKGKKTGNTPWKNKKWKRHSEETKRKISESKKGQVSWNKGKKETRSSVLQNQSVAHLGQIAWNKDKTGIYSEETLEKIRNARSKQIVPLYDTKPEKMLQSALMLENIPFKKHKVFKVGKSNHQVDLFIKPDICIEVDGPVHRVYQKQMERDVFIDKELKAQGLRVIRFLVKRTKDFDIRPCVKIIKDMIMPENS